MINNLIVDQPFKDLEPYEIEDMFYFFGREAKGQEIARDLENDKLTVLFGASGIGKSSLLRAGVAGRLQLLAKRNLKDKEIGVPKFAVVVFEDWHRPDLSSRLLEEVRRAVITAMKGDLESFQDEAVSLQSQVTAIIAQEIAEAQEKEFPLPSEFILNLLAWARIVKGEYREGRLLIILDQFEDYFQPIPQSDDQFAKDLSDAINWDELPVNFLISIQEAWLSKLDFFKRRIPNVLDNLQHIDYLDKEDARKAIIKPIEAFNLQQTIFSHLNNASVIEIHGRNSIGKSFVLNAGIIDRLRKQTKELSQQIKSNSSGFIGIIFNSWEVEPVSGLKRQIEIEINDLFENQKFPIFPPSFSLSETLQECMKFTGEYQLLLILDQFEEYFLSKNGHSRFIIELEQLIEYVKKNSLPVSIFICIQTEQRANLKQLQDYIDVSLHIVPTEDGSITIESSGNEAYEIDPELVKELLSQTDQIFPGDQADGRIEPLYLQLVMTRLWEQTVKEKKYCLTSRILSDLGGVKKIINDHVKKRIEGLLPFERQLAITIFYYLVTPSGKQIAYTASDLDRYIRDLPSPKNMIEMDSSVLLDLLKKLTSRNVRLLRYVTTFNSLSSDEAYYEIFHRLFAQPILDWLQDNKNFFSSLYISYSDWYAKARSLEKQGSYEEAINSYDQALTIRKDDYWAWYGKGKCWKELWHYQVKQGNTIKARECHQKAIDSFKQAQLQYSDWYQDARSLEDQKYYEEACDYYDQALKSRPEDYWAWYGRGICCKEVACGQRRQGKSSEAQKSFRKAYESFEKALEVKPRNYEASTWIKWISAELDISNRR